MRGRLFRRRKEPQSDDLSRRLEGHAQGDRAVGERDPDVGDDVPGCPLAGDRDRPGLAEVPRLCAPDPVHLLGGHRVLEGGCHPGADVLGPPVKHPLDDLANALVPFGPRRLRAGRAGVAARQG